MYIYVLTLLLSTFSSYVLKRNRRNIFNYKLFFYFTLLMLIISPTIRSSIVGTDSGNYVGSFYKLKELNDFWFNNTTSYELGYQLLERIANILASDYWALFFIISLIVNYFYLRTIVYLSENISMSLFLFITLGTYFFFFNGARQGIAAAIYSYSLIYLIKGDFKKYLFWVLIASFFHKTVLITIPFYFIFRLKFSYKNLFIIISVSIVIVFFSSYLLFLFPDTFAKRFTVYQDRKSSGAILLTVFYVLITLFFVFIRKYIPQEKNKIYDIYLNMTILTAIIYLFVSLSGQDVNLIRLTLYFSLSYILIWPIIFKYIKFMHNTFFKFTFYIIHFVFFIIFIHKMSNLLPYKINPYFL